MQQRCNNANDMNFLSITYVAEAKVSMNLKAIIIWIIKYTVRTLNGIRDAGIPIKL